MADLTKCTVFLRKIEYFQGILFLTTNRKDDIDDAFKSRIHVTITYRSLTAEAQAKIWEALITANRKKTSTQVDTSWTPQVFRALGQLQLNVCHDGSVNVDGVLLTLVLLGSNHQEHTKDGFFVCQLDWSGAGDPSRTGYCGD